jgi:dTDP-D-glucose 4,6-dehydratase
MVKDAMSVIGYMYSTIVVLLILYYIKGVFGAVYSVGGHNERTNLEVVKTIIHQLGKSEDLIQFVTDRLGHDKR